MPGIYFIICYFIVSILIIFYLIFDIKAIKRVTCKCHEYRVKHREMIFKSSNDSPFMHEVEKLIIKRMDENHCLCIDRFKFCQDVQMMVNKRILSDQIIQENHDEYHYNNIDIGSRDNQNSYIVKLSETIKSLRKTINKLEPIAKEVEAYKLLVDAVEVLQNDIRSILENMHDEISTLKKSQEEVSILFKNFSSRKNSTPSNEEFIRQIIQLSSIITRLQDSKMTELLNMTSYLWGTGISTKKKIGKIGAN